MARASRLTVVSAGAPSRIRLTGSSSTLPERVRGTSWICSIEVGDVAGGAVLADPLADPGDEVVVEGGAVAEDDEERHEAFGAGQRQVEHERVDDLVEGEDGPVDLARAHPDAAAVDRRVGAAAR